MSGFYTATICADCDPPVIAISTGYGSRCPRCGQVKEPQQPRDTLSTRPDGVLARQVLTATALRSDGDGRLLAVLAQRLLDHAGAVEASSMQCPHCAAGEPSVWDDVLEHFAHPTGSQLKMCHEPWRERRYVKPTPTPSLKADPDLSDAHVDRVARKLFRAFDDANEGLEPLHDFDVMSQCEHQGHAVVANWRALAREAIRHGAVTAEDP